MSTARNNTTGAHERRCRYASKRCENPRAVKRNGELHRFCEDHRKKANLNQKRNDQKKKEGGKRSESDDVADDEQEVQRHDHDLIERGKSSRDESSRLASGLAHDCDDDEEKCDDDDDDDDDDDAFHVGALDISQLDPDELDDNEIEELQALVVAGHLQHITEPDPTQRIQ